MSIKQDSSPLIIGGGLSGASLGIHLAEAGSRPQILEKSAGPHHKVCGEVLQAETLDLLEECGINLKKYDVPYFYEARLFSRHQQLSMALPRPAAGLSRYVLDELLLVEALKRGAKVQRSCMVQRLQTPGQGLGAEFIAVCGDKTFSGKTLFLATGKMDLPHFRKRAGKEGEAIGFKIHLKLSSSQHSHLDGKVDLYFYPGGYAGLCHVEGGKSNLCFLLDKKFYRESGGHFPGAMKYLKQSNPALEQVLQGSELLWPKPLTVAKVPYGHLEFAESCISQDEYPELYLLGDQMGVIPSYTGTGMAIAFWTAKTAAYCYSQLGPTGWQEYARRMPQMLRSFMNASYRIHHLMKSTFRADLMLFMGKHFPQVAHRLMEESRIPLNRGH